MVPIIYIICLHVRSQLQAFLVKDPCRGAAAGCATHVSKGKNVSGFHGLHMSRKKQRKNNAVRLTDHW